MTLHTRCVVTSSGPSVECPPGGSGAYCSVKSRSDKKGPAEAGPSLLGTVRAASLVRIEQQLTQGDENNDANDRHKEYGREGDG